MLYWEAQTGMMSRLFLLLLVLSLADVTNSSDSGKENHFIRDLHLLERLLTGERLYERGEAEYIEVDLIGHPTEQSSTFSTNRVYFKSRLAVDGNSNPDPIKGESCSWTKTEANPWWAVLLGDEPHCVTRVTIVNRIGEESKALTGAVVRAGSSIPVHSLVYNSVCGSPVSEAQASVSGGNVTIDCDRPIEARLVTIEIPAEKASLTLCEVRVWEVPLEECTPDSRTPTEMNKKETMDTGQSSTARLNGTSLRSMLAVDGNAHSCSRTASEANPWWGVRLIGKFCISKVSILNQGDAESQLLEGAVIRVGYNPREISNNTACGSPVTEAQATVPGATIEVECHPPLKGQFVIIQIPAEDAVLQLCEVSIWELPYGKCEEDPDECESSPCQNGATCLDGVNEFTCSCAAGFGGTVCDIDIDECGSSPCQNGATCLDGVNEFTCSCAAGFGGTVCDIDIDECESSPCQNGATCLDGVNEFTCSCAAGFGGTVCDIEESPVSLDCKGSPCKNGICVNHGVDGGRCACAPGFKGLVCETNIDECSSNPCQNGGTCVDGVNKVSCTCPKGFTGLLCELSQEENMRPVSASVYQKAVETYSVIQVDLTAEYCIRKVVIRKRGDCMGDRLTGAVVRAGTNPAGTANRVCGSAVTNAQALERRSVVDFLCDPPLSAKYVSVDIPLIQASSQQICEVTVEEATPGPC